MSMVGIGRKTDALLNMQFTTSLATTPEIPFEDYSGGTLHIPSTSSITQLTWYTAPFQTGRPQNDVNLSTKLTQTFQPAKDSGGVAVVQTITAGNSFQIPAALFGAGALKAVITGGSLGTGSHDISVKS